MDDIFNKEKNKAFGDSDKTVIFVHKACQFNIEESVFAEADYIKQAKKGYGTERSEPYYLEETRKETVPQAIMAFLASTDFEDAIRNAISIGGDSDTIAAITGGIAGAYYGIPPEIRKQALNYLDERLLKILMEFEMAYPPLGAGQT